MNDIDADILKYFGQSLFAQSSAKEETGQCSVMGKYTYEQLALVLDKFIDDFVLCTFCHLPETDIIVLKNANVELFCKCCGHHNPVNMRLKLVAYIQKNPPPSMHSSDFYPIYAKDVEPSSEKPKSAPKPPPTLVESPCTGVKLNQFPADVLGHILRIGCFSQAIIDLWNCGDSILNAKLASGVTSLKLKSLRPNPFLPAMLFELKGLRSLSLTSTCKFAATHVEWVAILSKLPQHLKTLNIRFPNAPALFDTGVETSYARGSATFMDLGRLFPKLEKLGVYSNTWVGETFETTALAALPSTLTSFATMEITFCEEKGHTSALLPPHLRKLNACVQIKSQGSPRPWLLSELEYISYFQLIDEDCIADCSWMPRSLTCFAVHPWFMLTPSLLRSLPPKLTLLSVQDIRSSLFAAEHTTWQAMVPPSVTELHFNDNLADWGLQRLPHSIKNVVDLGNFPGSYLRSLGSQAEMDAFWPPNLHSMLNVTFRYEDVQFLPKTLQTLSVDFWAPADPTSPEFANGLKFDFLPYLTDLTIKCLPSELKILRFPKSLKTLNLIESEGVGKDTLNELPSTLTALATQVKGFGDDSNRPWELPSHLTDLHLRQWNCEWMYLIPPTAKELRIDHLHGVRNSDSAQRSLIIENLPIGLESLVLSGDDGVSPVGPNTHISSHVFQTLNSLRSIQIQQFGCFASRVLRYLPSPLTELSLKLEWMDPADAPFIPHGLRSLHLGPIYDKKADYLADYWPIRAHQYASFEGEAKGRFEKRFVSSRSIGVLSHV